MHIQKLSLTICLAASVGASSLKAQSNSDSDAQAKARESLRQTITKLNTEASPNDVLVTSPRRMSPDNEAKVLTALHQTKAELDAQAAAAQRNPGMNEFAKKQAVGELSAEQRAAAAQSAKQSQASDYAARMNAANGDAAQKRAAADMEAKMKQGGTLASSPVLIPGSKEARLNDLLQLYRADKITPTEYHQQRAKIISEP